MQPLIQTPLGEEVHQVVSSILTGVNKQGREFGKELCNLVAIMLLQLKKSTKAHFRMSAGFLPAACFVRKHAC